jgi:hypothetical protein
MAHKLAHSEGEVMKAELVAAVLKVQYRRFVKLTLELNITY